MAIMVLAIVMSIGLGGVVATGAVWMFGHRVPAPLLLGAAPAPWLTGAVLGSVVVLALFFGAYYIFVSWNEETDAAVLEM